MNKSRIRHLMAFLLAGAVSGYAGTISAAGFAIIEDSAQGMGNAFAGGGAVAEDASTVWFNPASITRLPSQMQAAPRPAPREPCSRPPARQPTFTR